MTKAKFITFEGGEGSGKSTQSKKLYEYLLSKDIKAIHTREVGGTVQAEKIRDILVYNELYPVSELMLVMAARYEHINQVIAPALVNDVWVICDRFLDSTVAYQADGINLTAKEIVDLHRNLMKPLGKIEAIMPEITFFMDLPPEIALKRSVDTKDINKFEEKSLAFHNKVQQNFIALRSSYPSRIKRIECVGKDEMQIHKEIIRVILPK